MRKSRQWLAPYLLGTLSPFDEVREVIIAGGLTQGDVIDIRVVGHIQRGDTFTNSLVPHPQGSVHANRHLVRPIAAELDAVNCLGMAFEVGDILAFLNVPNLDCCVNLPRREQPCLVVCKTERANDASMAL
jgi:hypothetical protein